MERYRCSGEHTHQQAAKAHGHGLGTMVTSGNRGGMHHHHDAKCLEGFKDERDSLQDKLDVALTALDRTRCECMSATPTPDPQPPLVCIGCQALAKIKEMP